jgi:hypothetical protein
VLPRLLYRQRSLESRPVKRLQRLWDRIQDTATDLLNPPQVSAAIVYRKFVPGFVAVREPQVGIEHIHNRPIVLKPLDHWVLLQGIHSGWKNLPAWILRYLLLCPFCGRPGKPGAHTCSATTMTHLSVVHLSIRISEVISPAIRAIYDKEGWGRGTWTLACPELTNKGNGRCGAAAGTGESPPEAHSPKHRLFESFVSFLLTNEIRSCY